MKGVNSISRFVLSDLGVNQLRTRFLSILRGSITCGKFVTRENNSRGRFHRRAPRRPNELRQLVTGASGWRKNVFQLPN